MYLKETRPDIILVVSLISIFMEIPKSTHWQEGKMILIYVVGTTNYGVLYTSNSDFKLIGYTDNDFVVSVDDKKSTLGYVFSLGSQVVAWASKKDPIVTLSSVEDEYVEATTTACQTVWMGSIVSKFLHEQKEPTQILCDNKSTISLLHNHVFHKKAKHIDTKYHFIREMINNDESSIEFCKYEDQFVNIFSKSLAKELFEIHKNHIGVCEL